MAQGGGSFSDVQFDEACAELEQPALTGADWELLVEFCGISVYRLYDQRTGLYEYKVFGVLRDCSPDLLADVYMDLVYRKKWDEYVSMKYVYVRERRDLDKRNQKIYVILSQSTSVPEIPEVQGVIRVKQYKQSLAIKSDGQKGSKVFMHYFDNPGGQIPTWLVNLIAKVRSQEQKRGNVFDNVVLACGAVRMKRHLGSRARRLFDEELG
ncbi:Phosphatidylcholine transfer protein [Tupaia chinensis]|uniref:Phosphatidylcholine transfer protein n=1 Tax=Tupaia chinensis TaxID=246437 RepID=L9KGL5_TUPCH|nr:Phosphatidylcholine transfer protein [Tupaia chinensis]